MAVIVLLDVDGTLVDSNYQHALAWYRAFREHGLTLSVAVIHRAIGMGGDQLVAALAGEEFDAKNGDGVRAAESSSFQSMIDEVELLPGAPELLRALRGKGAVVILASSAAEGDMRRYLDLLGGERVVDGWTTADDVGSTKPAPDLLDVARGKGGDGPAVMVGDSVWDVKAGLATHVLTVGTTTGGISAAELQAAGAVDVYESLPALTADLAAVISHAR